MKTRTLQMGILGLLLGVARVAGGETLKLDVDPVKDASKVALEFTAMNPRLETPEKVTRERLDAYFDGDSPRYRIASNDVWLVKDLARVLEGFRLEALATPAAELDLRYRLVVTREGQELLRFYVDTAGRLLWQGKAWGVAGGSEWLRKTWNALNASKIYGPSESMLRRRPRE